MKFKCPFCDYQARSSNSLNSHISRKHTKYDENLSSYKCEFCGNEYGNGTDLKEHMFQHPFKRCDQLKWGPNEHTMKMHMYRNHSKIVACAMCNFEAKEENFLDTHTFTCEIFNCHYCQSTYVARYKNSYEHRMYSSFWHYKIN